MAKLEQTLSIVVPAYNEQEGLPMQGEIVYVNDGARDGTLEVT